MISMNKAPKLTPEERKMLNKSFYFSLGTNMASSKVSQQSKCFAMAMAPGLEMFYDDPEDRRKAFYRHAGEFFNTHQVFLGLLVGISLAMEKQQAEHPEDDITETISTLKASLMGPTAGIGDSFFWGTFRVIGVGVGAVIHNWIPESWIQTVLGSNNPFGVVLAVLVGVPMYADIFGTIPVAEALLAKGAQLGTILSFMMAVTTLSLPSIIMLKKAVKPKLLVLFIVICTLGIVIVGYLFNVFQYLLI